MSLREPERIIQAEEASDNITLLSASVNTGPGIETTHTKSPADNLPGLMCVRRFVGDRFHDLLQ